MSAIGTIGGALIGGLFGQSAQKRQFRENKKMFDYQNAYNTPLNQMKRLRSAGLNPALMYGQGNTGNSQQNSAIADYNPAQVAQSASAGAQIANSLVLQDLQKSQKNLNNTDAMYKTKDIQNKTLLTQYQTANLAQDLSNKMQEVQESISRELLNNTQRDLASVNIKVSEAQIPKINAEIEKLTQDAKLTQIIREVDYKDGVGRNWQNNAFQLYKYAKQNYNMSDVGILALGVALKNPKVAIGSAVTVGAKMAKGVSKFSQSAKNLGKFLIRLAKQKNKVGYQK